MKKIRVLVVDDSALMRRMIGDIIAEQPDMELSGVAGDGLEALAGINASKPDVVTLDLEMPHMDGFETLRNIMRRFPLPIIMVSSYTKAGSEATLKALSAGALDFIPKPAAGLESDTFTELRHILPLKIRAAAAVKPGFIKFDKKQPAPAHKYAAAQKERPPATLIAIGASTGGPKALEVLFSAFPAELPAAILLSLHMPPGFTLSYANRLNTLSAIQVKEGAEGDNVYAGRALIAPGGYHMKLRKDRISLDTGSKVNFVRPSIDVMLDSLIDAPYKVIVVILTGMGKDGADGAANLQKYKKDTLILAQDPTTAMIPSMPEAVIKSAAVSAVLPLEKMASEILRHAARQAL